MKIPPVITHQTFESGTRVLVRASLDVPIVDGVIQNSFRIEQTLRTIKWLTKHNARVTVIGHLGREKKSLAPIHSMLNKSISVSFLPFNRGEEVYKAKQALRPGEVLLLENTRTDDREERNEFIYAEELGQLQDIFVMDDFSVAHREHSSTVGLIKHLESYIGVRFYEELTALSRITEKITHPAVAVIGGAKTKTKIPLISELLETCDFVFLGGITANTFLKAQGFQVGKSAVEEIEIPKELLESKKVIVPSSVVVSKDFKNKSEVSVSEVSAEDSIVDISETAVKTIMFQAQKAKTIIWNGPLGWYEKGFTHGSALFSREVGELESYSFVGGGDTVAVLEDTNTLKKWSFTSIGGGSVLTYLAKQNLPVLDAFYNKTR